jgi:hypothetical protein
MFGLFGSGRRRSPPSQQPSPSQYDDFVLTVTPDDGGYKIEGVAAGERGEGTVALSPTQWASPLIGGSGSDPDRSGGAALTGIDVDAGSLRVFGQALFTAVFTKDILRLYRHAQEKSQTRRLRICVNTDAPELLRLPWELLYDPDIKDHCVLQGTPLVRTPTKGKSPDWIAQSTSAFTPPLRVLGVVASPTGLGRLDTRRERERLENALTPHGGARQVQLRWILTGRWEDLLRELRQHVWHVFHFIGHGESRGNETSLAFVDGANDPFWINATRLARLLGNGNRGLKPE